MTFEAKRTKQFDNLTSPLQEEEWPPDVHPGSVRPLLAAPQHHQHRGGFQLRPPLLVGLRPHLPRLPRVRHVLHLLQPRPLLLPQQELQVRHIDKLQRRFIILYFHPVRYILGRISRHKVTFPWWSNLVMTRRLDSRRHVRCENVSCRRWIVVI